jgi:hypothetical protein
LEREEFRHVFTFNTPEEVDTATVERQPLWNNKKQEHGPFDIIGDIHGCYDELIVLLGMLGYAEQPGGAWSHSAGRKLVFLGDLVDRGPKSPEVVRLVMESVNAGSRYPNRRRSPAQDEFAPRATSLRILPNSRFTSVKPHLTASGGSIISRGGSSV